VENQVGHRNGGQYVASTNVPDENFAITAGAEQDIVGGGMPSQEADAPLVANQFDDWLSERSGEAVVGDLPHLYGGIFRSAGNAVVVEGTPGYAQRRTLVTSNK